MRAGINHIDKTDFLMAYPTARVEAFKRQNIQNSFAAAGLAPYDPERVLSKLNIQLKTPTPPGSSHAENKEFFTPKTPKNVVELQQQVSTIKAFLKRRSKTPPSPTNLAINQMAKAAALAMNAAAILAKQNSDLLIANKKQTKKRALSTRQIAAAAGLTVKESKEVVQPPRETVEQPRLDVGGSPILPILAPRTAARAPYKCSGCGGIGHKIINCPNK